MSKKHSDAFAVLAPIGPLRRISEKDHEYSDQKLICKALFQQQFETTACSLQVLRFLMFTAEDRNDEQREEIQIITILSLTPTNRLHEIYNITENIRHGKRNKSSIFKANCSDNQQMSCRAKTTKSEEKPKISSNKEAKSKHIQQRKALGRKSNICDETIRKICTKLGTSDE
ncbi:unnamed protein product [Brugia pahangi]|uniref:Uncharacterized protein n=1 Tax=Brugia pahangi TaxID=6280 RepID=A0A0N4T363_BRUPA|nr:unnamed protein product [Brugia pahangi]